MQLHFNDSYFNVQDAYEALRHEAEQTQTEINENELWFNASQPHNRGNVYGLGSAQPIFYDSQTPTRTRDASNAYAPGPYSQLQMELEAANKRNAELFAFMESQKKKDEERDRREMERDARERLRQEELERMRTYFENCNQGPPWHPRDPRDGPNGGGSAGSTFTTVQILSTLLNLKLLTCVIVVELETFQLT